MRMAQIMWAALRPHVKSAPDPSDFLLFPEERHDLPVDVSAQEQQLMMKLLRKQGD